MRLHNHFEPGTLGSRITAFGSTNPYAWDFVDGSAIRTTYDNTHGRGKMAGKFLTDATSAKAMCTWTPLGGQFGIQTDWYARQYGWLTSAPPVQTPIMACVDGTNSITCRVHMGTDGKLRITNAVGAVVATAASALTMGANFRIEWHIVHSITVGSLEARVYQTDPEAAVGSYDAALSVSASGINTGINAQGAQFGWCLSGANLPALWLDAIEVNNAPAWIGPSASEPVTSFFAWRHPVLGDIDQSNPSQNAVNDFITRLYQEVGRMRFVATPRRYGDMSMRFEVRKFDVTGGPDSERTTLNAVGTKYTDGDTFSLGLSVMLDPSFPNPVPDLWCLLYQLFGTSGGQSTGSPPFAFEVGDDGYFHMTVRGGVKAAAGDTAPYESFQVMVPATKSVWHDVIFDIHLSTTASGSVYAYHKLASESVWPVTPVASYTGVNMLTVGGVLQEEWNSMNIYRATRDENGVGYFGLAAIESDRELVEAYFTNGVNIGIDPLSQPLGPRTIHAIRRLGRG